MNWMEGLQAAINYIEEHLTENEVLSPASMRLLPILLRIISEKSSISSPDIQSVNISETGVYHWPAKRSC